jgi:predicted cupin superfamily sugar epimerase
MIKLGNDFQKNEIPQYVVPGGTWFAAEVLEESAYSFTGCTVSPGFDFADFEMGDRQSLITLYPHASDIIHKLTR